VEEMETDIINYLLGNGSSRFRTSRHKNNFFKELAWFLSEELGNPLKDKVYLEEWAWNK